MKSLFSAFLALATFLLTNVSPVYAQLTILPGTPEGTDCKLVMDEYEISGEIKSSQLIQAEAAAEKAQNDFNEYVSGLDDPVAFANCVTSGQAVGDEKCNELKAALEQADQNVESESAESAENFNQSELFGCAISTGRISLQLIPYFISYFANWLLAMIGIVAVLFIVLGGYFYIWGGLVEQKEKGKKYIVNALMGMSVALLSWVIVTIIVNAITG